MDAARTHSTEGENQRTRCTCNVYAIIRFVNDESDSNINSGWFIDEYNAFKTQSELIFLPFAANWGCKPAHGSVGVTTMTKTFRKSVIWVKYYMCTNFQRVLIAPPLPTV